jgi:hypothetical protein
MISALQLQKFDGLRSLNFNNNEDFVEGVKTWLSPQATNFFDKGVHKFIPWCDKCLNSGSDYVEK